MTMRDTISQPAIIYLLTSRGHLASPPLEWHDYAVEHRFIAPVDLYINGFIVAHPDGAVAYKSPPEMTPLGKGHAVTIHCQTSPVITGETDA